MSVLLRSSGPNLVDRVRGREGPRVRICLQDRSIQVMVCKSLCENRDHVVAVSVDLASMILFIHKRRASTTLAIAYLHIPAKKKDETRRA